MEDKQIINSESRLLSFEENEEVFRLLGSKCKSRSTAVVQLYATMPPNHNSWGYQFCGVATFVKDFSRRSFFIQVYDIEKSEVLFEQEIYKDFSYCVNPIFFHQFESENAIIGINFADEVEAEHFGTCILNYVERKQQKKVEMKQTKQVPTVEKVSKIKRSGRRSGSRRIRKSQIGHPENFRHIQHVGLDTGANSPENILSCIIDMSHDKSEMLGTPSSQQTTPNPFDEAFSEYSTPPNSQKARKPTPKPQHPNPLNMETRSKHHFDVPPNIPMSPKPQKKSPRLNSNPHSPLPRPPPPPPGQGSKPRILPPERPHLQEHVGKEVNQDSRGEEPSPRCDLLSEIRNPKLKLRHQEVNEDSRREEPSPRGDLLSEIRNPKLKLRHVDREEEKSKQASSSTDSNNILQTMAKVLEVRGRGVRGDSDDSYSDSSYSGDDDDDDSDW